jgi:uncharacterized protein (TIGR00730 family)
LSEYLEPLQRLKRHGVKNTVLFIGSARIASNDPDSPLYRYYVEAEELAYRVTRWANSLKSRNKYFVVCTGGGPGIMEAANRGARRADGKSIGMNISIPLEQSANSYISPGLNFVFHYFFMRKFFLENPARAVIAFPGGYGTLDELFDLLTLVQTKKVSKKRLCIILYGREYWEKILNFGEMIRNKVIDPEDVNIFTYKSTPEEAFAHLKKHLGHHLK